MEVILAENHLPNILISKSIVPERLLEFHTPSYIGISAIHVLHSLRTFCVGLFLWMLKGVERKCLYADI